MWGGISGIGMAAGPVLGGVLSRVAGWRSIFLVNVPVCLVAIVMIRRWATESPGGCAVRSTFPGWSSARWRWPGSPAGSSKPGSVDGRTRWR